MRSYARLLPTLLLVGIMMVGCLGMDSTTAPSDPPLRTLTLTGTFTWTVASGVMQGAFAPISGSTATMSGTASESGAISASIPAGSNGCSVNLTGQLATSSTGGITGATATGTYSLVASSTCNSASGTWSAIRR